MTGADASMFDRFEVVVDQDAESADWDEALAIFLLDFVRKRTAPAGASTAVALPDLEALRRIPSEYFNSSV